MLSTFLPRGATGAQPSSTGSVALAARTVDAFGTLKIERDTCCLLNGTAVRAPNGELTRPEVPPIPYFPSAVNIQPAPLSVDLMLLGEGMGGLANMFKPRLKPGQGFRTSSKVAIAMKNNFASPNGKHHIM